MIKTTISNTDFNRYLREFSNSGHNINRVVWRQIKQDAIDKQTISVNIMNKYGDNRRTKIKDLVETDNENIEVKTKDVAVLLSKDKIIKAIDISELKTTSKGTKGTLIDKNLLDYCLATNKDKILLIDDEGNGQTIDVNLFLNTEMNLNFLTNFGNVIKIAKYQKMSYIIITTKQGYIKKFT